jgi:hypothetical protein
MDITDKNAAFLEAFGSSFGGPSMLRLIRRCPTCSLPFFTNKL